MKLDHAGTIHSCKRNGLDPQSNTKVKVLPAVHDDKPTKLQGPLTTESSTIPLGDYPELSIRRTWSIGGHPGDPLCVEYRYSPKISASTISWILWGLAVVGLAYVIQVYGSDWVSPSVGLVNVLDMLNSHLDIVVHRS